MKPSFRSRMERLEARAQASQPPMLRIGYLTRLPEDFTGERHVVIKREPTGSPGDEWFEFEERPGLAPPGSAPPGSDDGGLTIYLTR